MTLRSKKANDSLSVQLSRSLALVRSFLLTLSFFFRLDHVHWVQVVQLAATHRFNKGFRGGGRGRRERGEGRGEGGMGLRYNMK